MTKNVRKNVPDEQLAELFRRYGTEFSDFDGLTLSDPDQCGYGEDSPLHVAARHGLKDDIAVLVKAGASVNKPGELGFTPLHNAAMAGRLDAAKQLLQLGANPRLLNEFDQTAADVAELGGHEDLARLLKSTS